MPDLSRSDDCIIAEALVYREDKPDQEVALLSHDTGLLGMAKDCGLAVQPVPDTWLRPPEPDERSRRIVQLEELTRHNPKISNITEDRAKNLPEPAGCNYRSGLSSRAFNSFGVVRKLVETKETIDFAVRANKEKKD